MRSNYTLVDSINQMRSDTIVAMIGTPNGDPPTDQPAEPARCFDRSSLKLQLVHRFAIASLPVIAAAVLLCLPLPLDWRTAWRSKLLDLGHVPLFALLTVCAYRSGLFGRWSALGLATIVAGCGELVQQVVHRSSDVADFLRGVIGAVLGILWLGVVDRPRTLQRLCFTSALTAVLLGWPVADALPKLWDAYAAYRSFPVLCDFQSRWESARWAKEHVTMDRVPDDQEGGRWLGRMVFYPDARGSGGAVLFPVVRDWTNYRQLCCEFSFIGEPLSILISIRDGRKVSGPLKRFDLEREYTAGEHRITIDLSALARGEQFAPLDLSRVESFHYVVGNIDQPRTVYLRSVRLE